MESGGCDELNTDINTQTLLSQGIANYSGCPSSMGDTEQVACMRNLTSLQLAYAYYNTTLPFSKSSNTFTYKLLRPIVDGYVIPDYPQNIFAAGKQNKVNALFGDCNNEGGLWIEIDPTWQINSTTNPNGAQWSLPVAYLYNSTTAGQATRLGYGQPFVTNASLAAGNDTSLLIEELEQVYGPNGVISQAVDYVAGPSSAVDNIITYSIFTCPTRRTGRGLDNIGMTTWAFDFQYYAVSSSPFEYLGATHGSDLAYFMDLRDNSYTAGTSAFTAAQQELSNAISTYLVNFVVNQNPNTPSNSSVTTLNMPYWPQYNASSGIYMNFGSGAPGNTTIATTLEPFGPICDLVWDQLVPQLSFTGLSNTTT